MVSFRNSWGDLDLYDNENVWGQEMQYKFWYDARRTWWTICGASETNGDKWRLPVDFCRLDCPRNPPEHCSFCHLWQWEWMSDIMLDQLWPLYLPLGSVDEDLNHTLWLSLHLSSSKISLFSLSFLISPLPPSFLSAVSLSSSENMICHGDWERR